MQLGYEDWVRRATGIWGWDTTIFGLGYEDLRLGYEDLGTGYEDLGQSLKTTKPSHSKLRSPVTNHWKVPNWTLWGDTPLGCRVLGGRGPEM